MAKLRVRISLRLALAGAGVAGLGLACAQDLRGQLLPKASKPEVQQRLRLTRTQTITSRTETATSFLPPLQCDSAGNLYYQIEPHERIVHELNPKAEPLVLLRASSSTDIKVAFAGFFAIDQNDAVHQLIFPQERSTYVFTYHADGTVKSETKLNTGFYFEPHAIPAFPSGHWLIAGEEYDQNTAAAMWPVTGIFAADGKLLKEIKLEDDESLHDMAASGDARVSQPGAPQTNKAVDFTQVEVASDGEAYLMRWTSPAIFYAISPGGEVVRRFTVDPGDSNFLPVTMHIFQNRIAVLFINTQTHDKLMKIVDLDGNKVAVYDQPKSDRNHPDDSLGGAFACYRENPTRFTFLGASEDNHLQLRIGEPR